MTKKINETYPFKCENCNSVNVQQKEWVEINTGKIMGACSDGEQADNWCPDCETHCKIINNYI
jgi:hypothetical protein